MNLSFRSATRLGLILHVLRGLAVVSLRFQINNFSNIWTQLLCGEWQSWFRAWGTQGFKKNESVACLYGFISNVYCGCFDSMLHMCSVLLSTTSYITCLACLYRVTALRTIYVTWKRACIDRITYLRTTYLTCVACWSRLRAQRTRYVTCVACSYRLMALRTR